VILQIFGCWCVYVVFLLNCAVQTYAWGKKGSSSEVACLMKSANHEFVIDENTTYAEVCSIVYADNSELKLLLVCSSRV